MNPHVSSLVLSLPLSLLPPSSWRYANKQTNPSGGEGAASASGDARLRERQESCGVSSGRRVLLQRGWWVEGGSSRLQHPCRTSSTPVGLRER